MPSYHTVNGTTTRFYGTVFDRDEHDHHEKADVVHEHDEVKAEDVVDHGTLAVTNAHSFRDQSSC